MSFLGDTVFYSDKVRKFKYLIGKIPNIKESGG